MYLIFNLYLYLLFKTLAVNAALRATSLRTEEVLSVCIGVQNQTNFLSPLINRYLFPVSISAFCLLLWHGWTRIELMSDCWLRISLPKLRQEELLNIQWKKRSERRKHCALAVVKFSPRCRPPKPSNCFRRLEKSVLPSIFDTSLSSFMMWNLHSYPTTVLNERMWHFRGSKHTVTHSYISGPTAPMIYAPVLIGIDLGQVAQVQIEN